jgi:hypothetical protein
MNTDILLLVGTFLRDERSVAKLLLLSRAVRKLTYVQSMTINAATVGILGRVHNIRKLSLEYVILDTLTMPHLVELELNNSAIDKLIAPELVLLRLRSSICPPPAKTKALEFIETKVPQLMELPDLQKLKIISCQVTKPSWRLCSLEELIIEDLCPSCLIDITPFTKLKYLRVARSHFIYGSNNSLETIEIYHAMVELTACGLKYCRFYGIENVVVEGDLINYNSGYIRPGPRIKKLIGSYITVNNNIFSKLRVVHQELTPVGLIYIPNAEIDSRKDIKSSIKTYSINAPNTLGDERGTYTANISELVDPNRPMVSVTLSMRKKYSDLGQTAVIDNLYYPNMIVLQTRSISVRSYEFPCLLELKSYRTWFNRDPIPYAPALEKLHVSCPLHTCNMGVLATLTRLREFDIRDCSCDEMRNDNVTNVTLQNCKVGIATFPNAKVVKIVGSTINELIVPSVTRMAVENSTIGRMVGRPYMLRTDCKNPLPKNLYESTLILKVPRLSMAAGFPNIIGADVVVINDKIPKNLEYLSTYPFDVHTFDPVNIKMLDVKSHLPLDEEEIKILKQRVKYVNVRRVFFGKDLDL